MLVAASRLQLPFALRAAGRDHGRRPRARATTQAGVHRLSEHGAQDVIHPELEGGLEIVLVNDGSPDNSGDACRALLPGATVPITYLEHARNFGEHNAVMTKIREEQDAADVDLLDVDLHAGERERDLPE